MSLESDDAAAAAVAVAPRVTLADIQNNILHESYVSARDISDGRGLTESQLNALGTFTICLLVLRNGYVVIGKSAPAEESNYNRTVGEQFAYDDAIRQVWPLMGYMLRQRRADLIKAQETD